jgi:hypothetical protein
MKSDHAAVLARIIHQPPAAAVDLAGFTAGARVTCSTYCQVRLRARRKTGHPGGLATCVHE